MNTLVDESSIGKYNDEGYLGPLVIFDETECENTLKALHFPHLVQTWYKAGHEKSKRIIKAASNKKIVSIVSSLIGEDILLWRSIFIVQSKAMKHNLHLDVEHGKWSGVTLWLGLRNLEETKVFIITRSHSLPITPQELSKQGVDISNDQEMLRIAQTYDPLCELKYFILNPGELVLWEGRIWHGTINEGSLDRAALILQYSPTSEKTYIPKTFSYPDTEWEKDVNPPCVLINGNDNYQLNYIINSKKVGTILDYVDTYIKLYKKKIKPKIIFDIIKSDLKNNFNTY